MTMKMMNGNRNSHVIQNGNYLIQNEVRLTFFRIDDENV